MQYGTYGLKDCCLWWFCCFGLVWFWGFLNLFWNTSFWNICDRIRSNLIFTRLFHFIFFQFLVEPKQYFLLKKLSVKKCLDSGHLLCVPSYTWTSSCGTVALWSMDLSLSMLLGKAIIYAQPSLTSHHTSDFPCYSVMLFRKAILAFAYIFSIELETSSS